MKERSFDTHVSGKALLAALVLGVAAGAYAYDDNLAWKYEGGTTPAPAATQTATQAEGLSVFVQSSKDADVGETLETRPCSTWFEKFAYEFERIGMLILFK